MNLTDDQLDRAAGVLLGQAVGDALGVPYEFGTATYDPEAGPELVGGGLGGYAPGEWSDDTQMAVCVAEIAATGVDLTSDAGLTAVTNGFLRWYASGPADIGNQTRAVLGATQDVIGHAGSGPDGWHRPMHDLMQSASWDHHEKTGRSAGNGALMRTSVVGLVALDDPDRTARSARAVARLTHWDTLAGDSCALWSEAVRLAVVEGVLDLRAGLEVLGGPQLRARWAGLIDEAESNEPATFTPNGFTVTALQAAWSAIHHTGDRSGADHVEAALRAAIGIGDDTDTVAAIAGGLLGARYGMSALPARWTDRLHGWPGLVADDLVRLAVLTAQGG